MEVKRIGSGGSGAGGAADASGGGPSSAQDLPDSALRAAMAAGHAPGARGAAAGSGQLASPQQAILKSAGQGLAARVGAARRPVVAPKGAPPSPKAAAVQPSATASAEADAAQPSAAMPGSMVEAPTPTEPQVLREGLLRSSDSVQRSQQAVAQAGQAAEEARREAQQHASEAEAHFEATREAVRQAGSERPQPPEQPQRPATAPAGAAKPPPAEGTADNAADTAQATLPWREDALAAAERTAASADGAQQAHQRASGAVADAEEYAKAAQLAAQEAARALGELGPAANGNDRAAASVARRSADEARHMAERLPVESEAAEKAWRRAAGFSQAATRVALVHKETGTLQVVHAAEAAAAQEHTGPGSPRNGAAAQHAAQVAQAIAGQGQAVQRLAVQQYLDGLASGGKPQLKMLSGLYQLATAPTQPGPAGPQQEAAKVFNAIGQLQRRHQGDVALLHRQAVAQASQAATGMAPAQAARHWSELLQRPKVLQGLTALGPERSKPLINQSLAAIHLLDPRVAQRTGTLLLGHLSQQPAKSILAGMKPQGAAESLKTAFEAAVAGGRMGVGGMAQVIGSLRPTQKELDTMGRVVADAMVRGRVQHLAHDLRAAGLEPARARRAAEMLSQTGTLRALPSGGAALSFVSSYADVANFKPAQGKPYARVSAAGDLLLALGRIEGVHRAAGHAMDRSAITLGTDASTRRALGELLAARQQGQAVEPVQRLRLATPGLQMQPEMVQASLSGSPVALARAPGTVGTQSMAAQLVPPPTAKPAWAQPFQGFDALESLAQGLHRPVRAAS